MSRAMILKNIRLAKSNDVPLPEINVRQFSTDVDLKKMFVHNVESVGGKIVPVRGEEEIVRNIRVLFPEAKEIISCIEGIDIGTVDAGKISSAKELDKLDAAIIEGQFGVAENGAVWATDKNFAHRSIPFIASHVVIVLQQNQIVENMHEAVLRLNTFEEGYGVFISGPSKTADIEQSLVIGAQGPLSLTIFLV